MVSVQIDYYNLKFMVYEDGKLTMDNPLPAEIQQAVLLQVMHDVVSEIRAQVNQDVPEESISQVSIH